MYEEDVVGLLNTVERAKSSLQVALFITVNVSSSQYV